MNYQETTDWMASQLPMYHRIGAAAYKADLRNTLLLDEHYGHPHLLFPTVHVAGTNAKGSVAHCLASIFQEAGYRTGLYTSPHLKDFRERIRINGTPIEEEYVVRFVEEGLPYFQTLQPSFFEMTVALAFKWFADQKVDIAIIEVGLGGRLDSTNIITPELSVITHIAFDHMALLGDTLPKIAAEKAGIIKAGVPVVTGPRDPDYAAVIEAKASALNAPLTFALEVWECTKDSTGLYHLSSSLADRSPIACRCGLAGDYQRLNLPIVVESIYRLRQRGWMISDEHITKGIEKVVENTSILGRWQTLSTAPLTLCDVGHNPDAVSEVVRQISRTPHKTLRVVLGMVADKDIDGVMALWPKENAVYYFCKAAIPRGMDAGLLAEKARNHGLYGEVYPSVKAAAEAARCDAGPDDLVFIGGSVFTVAEVL